MDPTVMSAARETRLSFDERTIISRNLGEVIRTATLIKEACDSLEDFVGPAFLANMPVLDASKDYVETVFQQCVRRHWLSMQAEQW